MRLVFMGTPDFSVPTLGELIGAGHEIVAVYTQPPRKAGRGMAEQKSPVHRFAEEAGIEVRTPTSLRSPEEQAAFAALEAEVAIVVAYGLILPQQILDAPAHGCLNLHASLLPRWRGAAPIQRAILAGDEETGVMVMQMEAGLDTGPVLLAERVSIGPRETASGLHDRLMQVGGSLMVRALAALERGGLAAVPQAEDGVTYAEKIRKDEARIDWHNSAIEIDRQIRALSPFPGAFFEVGDAKQRVKILRAEPTDESGDAGAVLRADTELMIACGEGAVRVAEVQPAGKKAMGADAYLRGAKLAVGDKLG